MNDLISPLVLYSVCVLGAAGLALALPRRAKGLVPVGMVLLAGALGLAAVSLGVRGGAGGNPGVFFYVFAAIALGAAVRVITHPRPVYSALYFILTIIASCGMYVLLGAEFMAFALVIIYAGAILITYLFVIMLATQAPTGHDAGMIDETDAVAREPVIGAGVGFVMMGLIATMLFGGLRDAPAGDPAFEPDAVLAHLPGKVDRFLRDHDLIASDERVARTPEGGGVIDAASRTILIENADTGTTRVVADWPEGLEATNLDRLGWNLLGEHPMTIEIAGVILLMAMLGATVLARKHVELEESLKAEQARRRLHAPHAEADRGVPGRAHAPGSAGMHGGAR